jgi:uncharacterized repeat protein (TIGR03806 family)
MRLLGCVRATATVMVVACLVFAFGEPCAAATRPANPNCVAMARPPSGATIALQQIFPRLSLSQPILMLQMPRDDSYWFVVEKSGRVLRIPAVDDPDPAQVSVYLDISSIVNSAPNEAGLLGMAFHPDFGNPDPLLRKDEVFVSYTTGSLTSVIARYTLLPGGDALDPDSEVRLLTLSQPYSNHNGGNIAFGPDGYLYIGFGDGGSGGDPQGNGQNTGTWLGSLLRIDVDNGSPYAIPGDNPFSGGGGLPEIYAWGLRNPWRWSFDHDTGDLWVGDVGQGTWEEVDHVQLGGNYGWNIREGMHCYNAASCDSTGLVDPIVEYSHTGGNCSITGGYVYRGSAVENLRGTYLFGDYCSGRIWGIAYDDAGAASAQQLLDTAINIDSFAQGNDGELYVLGLGGQINRIVAAGPPPADSFPKKLSETGCVNPADPTEPDPGLIPYDVNAPLWSDGAEKSRWLAIPDGTSITIASDGDFDFPVGSVLVKEFRLHGKRVETRLFMRHDDGGWAGYAYAWNAAQTDADLVAGGLTVNVDGQDWRIPSGAECLRCHTAAAGYTLGPEIRQLNRDFTYPSGGATANQLSTLADMGVFSAPLPDAPANLPALSSPADTLAPLHYRARAYLHANCSMCHRPGGPGGGPADFRAQIADADMGVCNTPPEGGDLGVSGAMLVLPGDAAHSIVSLRTHMLDVARMPPLGSRVVDPTGTSAIDDWINVGALCGLPDQDGDGVTDTKDNCLLAYNPRRVDADGDQIGNLCDADLNNDLIVDADDLLLLLNVFSGTDATADLNTDGTVDSGDVGIFMNRYGAPPGPSGIGL